MTTIPASRPPAPTVSTTDYLAITAYQFQSFATPAITVPFPSVYAQSQIPFAFVSTATFAATRVPTTIGGIPATSGISTALYAAGTKYGQAPDGAGAGGGGGSGWPLWATIVIAACGGAALIIIAICVWCFCLRPSKRSKRRTGRNKYGTEKIALDQRLRANEAKEYRKRRRGSFFGIAGPPASNNLRALPLGPENDDASGHRRAKHVPAALALVDEKGAKSRAYPHAGSLNTPQRQHFRERSADSDVPLAYDGLAYDDSPTAYGDSPAYGSPGKAPWLMQQGSNSSLGNLSTASPSRAQPAWIPSQRNSLDRSRGSGDRRGRRNSFSAPGSPLLRPESPFERAPRASSADRGREGDSFDRPRRSHRPYHEPNRGQGLQDGFHAR